MIRVTECKSLNELQALRGEWSQLVEASRSASVFSGWEWAETFWRYVAPGREPLILLARDERNRLVGVLPLARTRQMRLVRVLEVLGCNERGYPMADYGGLLAEHGVEHAVWEAILRYLKGSHWAVMDLRNCIVSMPGDEEALTHFYGQAAAELNLAAKVQHGAMCRRISLPATFDRYLAMLSSNSRQNIRRKLRKLAEGGFTIEQVRPATQGEEVFNEAFDALITYHQQRWAENPTGGAFPTQRSRDLQRDVARRLDGAGQLDLRVMRDADRRIVGVIYNLRRKGVGYFYGLGVSQEEKYVPLSLGNCLLAESIAAAIEAGCHTFDLMRGDHEYKHHFGGYAVPNLRVTLYQYMWLPRLEQWARWLRGRLRRPAALSIEPAPLHGNR